MWPIERLRQAERHAAPPEPREPAAAGQQHPRSVPRGGGWRPGARWAREDQLGHVALPPEGGRSGEESAPLVTSIRDGNRIVIAAADMAARSLGLAPGMALAQARAQVAGLDIRNADPEGDRAHLASLAVALARRWTPTVAIEGDDTLFLDLSGVAHLHGGEAQMAARLRRMLARLGYTARIAIADTPGAAWALAHFHRHPGEGRAPESQATSPLALDPGLRRDDERWCAPGQQAEALAPLPIEALRIDASAVELLHRLGVTRIAQLTAMPRAPLVKRFGTGLALQLDRALGRLSEPLHPVVPPEPIAIAQRFAEPIATAEAIEHWLGTLVPRLTVALAEKGIGATRIELIADRIDGVPQRIRIGLARPSRDGAHLLRLLVRRIEQVEPGYGVDALTLHVRRALPLGAEPFTERLDEEAAPDLAPLVDTLATRIGLRAMWRSRPVESDVPERSVTRMVVLDPPARPLLRGKRDDVRQLDRNPPLPPWHPGWPRPARLLARPERLDHVMAELPDHAPRRFTWRGQSHRVIRADGPERIQGEWWKRDAERASVRDYFRVEDEAGRRYWLFRSGDGERAVTGDLSWYLHGVFG
ncbi:DNA polymerase Y family protein [Sphingomonas sp. 7/4-4]|uniref:DUF6504 family protein n=1 Tax=Sphingomonas sp. 7/4-4 TaxID=3018446 RepID=UPI0022F3CD8B|nr:DUF6504 family protein [Sphingomonas sp. 7/4-4]WBY07229.1 DNA polymerase Y family protein [Sphingomonas sp. 7/4-4]